jgi:GNAT superfamily N-acetyltransferase
MYVWVAEPAEADAVARLLVGFRDHYGREWPSGNSILASVERLIEGRDTEYLLGAVDSDSPPAGVCQLRFRHSVWMAAEDCWLEDLYVAEAARGSGLGGALIDHAIARARARGCRRVELDTSEANQGARRLYARHGFSESAKSDPPARDLFLGLYFERD